MRVIKKEKQVKEIDVTVEIYTLCDKCNEKIKTGLFDVFECEFVHKTGKRYPEGGSGEEQKVELCQKCAVELVELLKENGYKIIYSEWDS
jgi:hypothetical protein